MTDVPITVLVTRTALMVAQLLMMGIRVTLGFVKAISKHVQLKMTQIAIFVVQASNIVANPKGAVGFLQISSRLGAIIQRDNSFHDS